MDPHPDNDPNELVEESDEEEPMEDSDEEPEEIPVEDTSEEEPEEDPEEVPEDDSDEDPVELPEEAPAEENEEEANPPEPIGVEESEPESSVTTVEDFGSEHTDEDSDEDEPPPQRRRVGHAQAYRAALGNPWRAARAGEVVQFQEPPQPDASAYSRIWAERIRELGLPQEALDRPWMISREYHVNRRLPGLSALYMAEQQEQLNQRVESWRVDRTAFHDDLYCWLCDRIGHTVPWCPYH